MTSAKAAQAWAELNERQRLYLSTIFDADQRAEADIATARLRWEKTPPASEWRQITYGLKLPQEFERDYTTVQNTLRRAGVHDSGSGSTLAALEKRGLVEITHDHVVLSLVGMVPRVRVRLTTVGRAAARTGAGTAGPATTPRGLMARWSFVALARLYAAGQRGLAGDSSSDPADRAPSWNTLLRLRDHKDGSHIEQFSVRSRGPGINPLTGRGYDQRVEHRVRLSERGRRHYEIHHGCYRETYPDLDVPEPKTRPEYAHSGLAAHTARPPRHLVRDTDLPVLVRLIELEATGACALRQIITREYQRIEEPVPDAVAAMPAGLLRREVHELTRTDKSIERLASHTDPPLVVVLDVPNGPLNREAHPTVELVVLTETGHEHYRRYRDDYAHTYPDLDLAPAE